MAAVDELELVEAVAEGVAFMDAIDKGLPEAERWYWVVEPATLDMSGAGCGCVMMQHSGSGYFLPHSHYGLGSHSARELGFVVHDHYAYKSLTALWIEQINDRRAAYFDRHPEAVLA